MRELLDRIVEGVVFICAIVFALFLVLWVAAAIGINSWSEVPAALVIGFLLFNFWLVMIGYGAT